MARNQIQFQKGISFATFQSLYGTEEQCHEALVKMRRSNGFVCPRLTVGSATVSSQTKARVSMQRLPPTDLGKGRPRSFTNCKRR